MTARDEGLWRAVSEHIVEGILVYDAETERVLECNEALRLMLGYDSDALRGMRMDDLVAHEREEPGSSREGRAPLSSSIATATKTALR